ncbi:hypothetical protein BGW36DRAFT_400919 [Talaromyces proteolyticus]|uniref:Amidohydrolase-related domain-containing protein n=1 Tax=Talaromyces proteolyticus TaxID=1131652 RepID=A0AAD4PV83_9EURO|nr:uncharacterized protein BGW36DRAFT_400919 [Talaromyces proteolyticus]KAH8690443.1 hypothetical protein BGW36DRAFT_400919 [Talaromyces proteolyticus]
MVTQLLLKSGTLLVHDEKNRVAPLRADLLIEGDRISRISAGIEISKSMKVIDCDGKIISPGFVDTHHHVWQSQQKGLHADQILLDYYHSGNLASSHYTPEDVFWGQLSGLLEAVDAGTTTIVDHAHLNYSSDHSREAIRATVASGIRSVFCYCAHPRVATWQPELAFEKEWFPDWVMATFRQLATMQPFGLNGRVRLGFAIDAALVPPSVLKSVFHEVRALGAQLITSHETRLRMLDNMPSAVKVMMDNDLLGPDILLSHANHTDAHERSCIQNSGAHISSTPATEMQMGHGDPIALQPDIFASSSLGIDCHTVCSSFLPSQMVTLLHTTRSRRYVDLIEKNEWDASVGPTVEDAFNLGTILGAKAIGLQDEIGSLKVGKKADIVIFEGRTPSMLSVSERHPVAGIVLHSSVRDISTVIVDGVITKRNYSLSPVVSPSELYGKDSTPQKEDTLTWEQIATEVERSRERLQRTIEETVNPDTARDGLIRSFLEDISRIR